MNTTTIKLAAFLGMVAIIGIGIGVISYHVINVVEVQRIPIQFGVDNTSGIIVEDQYLDFGIFMPGGGARKTVQLSSSEQRRFTVFIEGDAQGVVFPEPSTGILYPGEVQNITFTARAPRNMALGNYTGEAVIRILRR